jgi:large subunit ribosomal protein L26e
VTTVYRRKWVIHINGLTREKVNGSNAPVPVQPSKCVITKLKLDGDRASILARKGGKAGAGGKGKFSEAEVAAMEAVE